MAVTVKSAKEIELMREAGRRLEIVHTMRWQRSFVRVSPPWRSMRRAIK